MANTLKRDPTRTTALRKQYEREMARRFAAIKKAIRELINKDDVLGLKAPTFNTRQWQFHSNPQKVESFRSWLKEQVDTEILDVGKGSTPWTAKYADSAYRRGVNRAYIDTRKELLSQKSEVFEGSKAEFLRSSFDAPEMLSKIEGLYMRAFTELEGVTAAMDQQLSRILADGLANGHGAEKIARSMTDQIDKLTRTRAKVIARTETIRAHAEGQLDSFDALGVKELGVDVEWSTAGDDRVCAECASMEGQTFTVDEARGLIPLHPNCRCAWIPAPIGPKTVKPLSKKPKAATPKPGTGTKVVKGIKKPSTPIPQPTIDELKIRLKAQEAKSAAVKKKLDKTTTVTAKVKSLEKELADITAKNKIAAKKLIKEEKALLKAKKVQPDVTKIKDPVPVRKPKPKPRNNVPLDYDDYKGQILDDTAKFDAVNDEMGAILPDLPINRRMFWYDTVDSVESFGLSEHEFVLVVRNTSDDIAGFMTVGKTKTNYNIEFVAAVSEEKGSGSKLVRTLYKRAIAEDRPIFVIPAEGVEGFYQKNGFKFIRDSEGGAVYKITPEKMKSLLEEI